MGGNQKGKLLIFSAPSGAGKTTIVKNLLDSVGNLEFSISATSRERRGDEMNGVDYFFFSPDQFREKIKNDEFVEWEEVYDNHYYGTLHTELERIWAAGKHVVFDVDVQGGISLRRIFGERALSIFIMPPSVSTLRERLKKRGTDTTEKIEMRLRKSAEEIAMAGEFDHIIVNDNLVEACNRAVILVTDFLEE